MNSDVFHRRARGRWLIAGAARAAALTALLAACSSQRLVPLAPVGEGTAVVESDGISVSVDANAADRPAYLPAGIEPVKLSIHNASGQGVHVSLDAIELVGQKGSFATVQPESIEPIPRMVGMGLDPASPLGRHPGPVGVDLRLPSMYSYQYSYQLRNFPYGDGSRELMARRAEIMAKALQGGFIDAGQTLEGFVYFQQLPDGVRRLDLLVPVHSGQGSGGLVTLSVPLAVEG